MWIVAAKIFPRYPLFLIILYKGSKFVLVASTYFLDSEPRMFIRFLYLPPGENKWTPFESGGVILGIWTTCQISNSHQHFPGGRWTWKVHVRSKNKKIIKNQYPSKSWDKKTKLLENTITFWTNIYFWILEFWSFPGERFFSLAAKSSTV